MIKASGSKKVFRRKTSGIKKGYVCCPTGGMTPESIIKNMKEALEILSDKEIPKDVLNDILRRPADQAELCAQRIYQSIHGRLP